MDKVGGQEAEPKTTREALLGQPKFEGQGHRASVLLLDQGTPVAGAGDG